MLPPVALLSSPLALHDVRDAEALARSALRDHLRQGATRGESRPSRLSDEDFEDALSFLIGVAWDASRFYGPEARMPRIVSEKPFSHLCYWLMRRRVVDWYRQRFGSTRYRPRPELVALEEQGALEPAELLGLELSLSEHERSCYLCIALPFAESGLTSAGYAREIGMPRSWVEQGLAVVREALERQGIGPSSAEPELPSLPSSDEEDAECLAPSSALAAAG